MASHSCSASLSSYFSHTPSSHSSPPSSPDSAPPSSQDSLPPASSPASSSPVALVPFLWEEKPGVLKREMQSSKEDRAPILAKASPPAHRASLSCSTETLPPLAGDSDAHSSTNSSRTITGHRARMRSDSVPRLRPPPCLSQPNHVHALPSTDEDADLLPQRHHQFRTGVRSKVMSSFHFHKRWHHRTPSIEDDPFWMAMVACTNDTDNKGSPRTRCKSNRETKVQRSESWIAKRVQGNTISFEQCMPHRTSAGSLAVGHRGKSTPSKSHLGGNLKEKAQSLKGPAGAACSTSTRDGGLHANDRQVCTDTGAHLASKALKALNLATSEVHGRCKALLQQQGSPVDISCSTRLPRKPSSAAKRSKGDVFRRTSDHSSIVPP